MVVLNAPFSSHMQEAQRWGLQKGQGSHMGCLALCTAKLRPEPRRFAIMRSDALTELAIL
jgi:hypothetical protein